MSDSPNKLPRTRRWRAPIIILAVLGLGVAVAGAAIWWANRPIQATILTAPEKAAVEQKLAAVEQEPSDPEYVPGGKEIILTERELNGLLHENTNMGDQLKLELARDAVHARLSADIPEDFPIMAGKKLKGKARFVVKSETGAPALILDDLTIWGISLPNAWLGELKGQNLLGNVISSDGGSLAGVEDISVSNGQLVIKLAE
ncbi:hypothetical protein AAFN60_13605 [Roseibacillus persicicus]|uniref:Arginine N-succinyltransferase n=1 Tax=Roseibacillus persicicus TaxID=454148 RepID=A0A918WJK8_9BACT|nr:hypothetical protein [Roseibacillus persicicus]GHC48845.1 hypothetical protein GCM10007100_13480 [Roseibacillus persicicus]